MFFPMNKRTYPNRPAHVQEWLIARAKAKRIRRSMKANASNYAKQNAGHV
jgi:hypothetical protein